MKIVLLCIYWVIFYCTWHWLISICENSIFLLSPFWSYCRQNLLRLATICHFELNRSYQNLSHIYEDYQEICFLNCIRFSIHFYGGFFYNKRQWDESALFVRNERCYSFDDIQESFIHTYVYVEKWRRQYICRFMYGLACSSLKHFFPWHFRFIFELNKGMCQLDELACPMHLKWECMIQRKKQRWRECQL